MLHLLKIVTCVLLIQDLYTVDVLAMGDCVDRLMASLTDGADTCLAVTDYVKCMLLATSLYKTPNKDEDLRLLKRQMEDGLAERGVICDIDVMAIAEEHLENDRKGIEHTTTRPTGYNNAKTVRDCINTSAGEIGDEEICARLIPPFKCMIRVTKTYDHFSRSTDQERQKMDQMFKDRMNMLNIDCDFTLASLVEEVRREQGNGKNGAEMIVGSSPFVTLFILTCASVFVLH